jgi:hypothetical protein
MVNKAGSGLVFAIICCDCFATQQASDRSARGLRSPRIGRKQRVKISELGGLIRGGRIDGWERELGEGNKQNTAYSAVEILEGF